MSKPIHPPHGPSFPVKEQSTSHPLDTTPPLTMPRHVINTHPSFNSHYPEQKAEEIAKKAINGSVIHKTEQLFEHGRPKNGAAIIATLQTLRFEEFLNP